MNTTEALTSGNEPMYDEPMQEQARNPLMVLHLLLQGRYWLAVLLAILLGAGGAALGYKLPHRTYSSTGMIRIKPNMPIIGQDSGAMPMFESYVATQLILLKGEHVLDMAIDEASGSSSWQQQGKGNSAAERDAFAAAVDVSREGEIIRVTYTDQNPDVAMEGVKSILAAYEHLYLEATGIDRGAEMDAVTKLRDQYLGRLQSYNDTINNITGNVGVEAVMARYQMQVMQKNSAEMNWSRSKEMRDEWRASHPEAGTQPATAPAATRPASAPRLYTVEEIGAVDPHMLDLLRAKADLKRELIPFQGIGDSNQQKHQLTTQLQDVENQIQEYQATWRPPANGASGMPQESVQYPTLVLQEQLYHKEFDDASSEVLKEGSTVAQIQKTNTDMEMVKALLDSAKQKIEQYNIQLQSDGGVNIISHGDRPVLHDRRVPIAAAACFGGGVAGIAIVLLIGLMDRRLRTIDQARMSLKQGMRVLGMLPSLPRNLEDPGAASFAALCVHHIRMLLQVMPRMDAHPAIAVTSPSPGDGKTSLTLALALSFAASGKSTLLIDCDIVGAGLTRRVNAIIRRRIGQILIRENLITPAQLREALNLAQRSGRKLGEVLVDEGYVEQAQVTHALAMQAETSVGLLDVMRGEVLEECVADTGMARLWILPVGSALAEHGATISPEGFRAVLEQARKRFDIVLVDTGPVPGSIESSVAASQADGVVLCVSRGEQGPLVRRASEHLNDIGARSLGLVFNRATPEDFSSSYGAMSSPSIPARIPEKPGTDRATFGPVASAVAGSQVKKS